MVLAGRAVASWYTLSGACSSAPTFAARKESDGGPSDGHQPQVDAGGDFQLDVVKPLVPRRFVAGLDGRAGLAMGSVALTVSGKHGGVLPDVGLWSTRSGIDGPVARLLAGTPRARSAGAPGR
jgi:hypothetical protein